MACLRALPINWHILSRVSPLCNGRLLELAEKVEADVVEAVDAVLVVAVDVDAVVEVAMVANLPFLYETLMTMNGVSFPRKNKSKWHVCETKRNGRENLGSALFG
jgi:hypothetical protein